MNPRTPPPAVDHKLIVDIEGIAGVATIEEPFTKRRISASHKIHELLTIYRNSVFLFQRTGDACWRDRFNESELALRSILLRHRLASS